MMAKKNLQKSTEPRRVYLVDPMPIVRQGVASLLPSDKGFEICGQASAGDLAIQEIRVLAPDLVITELELAGVSGIDFIRTVQSNHADLRIFVYTSYREVYYADRAFKAGAMGYATKDEPLEVLLAGVRKVLDGKIHISEHLKDRLLNSYVSGRGRKNDSPTDALSARELEVFGFIGQGFGTREIAERLHLSVKTIETYRSHIKRKLNVGTASQLLRSAIEWVASRE